MQVRDELRQQVREIRGTEDFDKILHRGEELYRRLKRNEAHQLELRERGPPAVMKRCEERSEVYH